MKKNKQGNIKVRTSIRLIELTSKKGVAEFINESVNEIKENSKEYDLIKILFFINPILDRKIRNKEKYFTRFHEKYIDIWLRFYRLPDNSPNGLTIEFAKEICEAEDEEMEYLISKFNTK